MGEDSTLSAPAPRVDQVVDLVVTGLETSWNNREILAFDEAVDA